MGSDFCKLTIICAPEAEDELITLLLELSPPVPGLTTFAAEGHGSSYENATVAERVRGKIKRRILESVLPDTQAQSIVAKIKNLTALDAIYWIQPIEAFGRVS